MKINKLTRFFVLVMAAVMMMSCVAYANDLLTLVGNGKTYLSQVFAGGCLVFVLFGIAKLVAARNFTLAVLSGLIGAVLVYFIANPDRLTSLVDATLSKIL